MIKRDFKYILKRVIIGFLIGMLLFICKNKIAFASTQFANYNGATINFKFHFQPCYDDGTNVYCGSNYPDNDYLSDIEISRLVPINSSGQYCGLDASTGLFPTGNKFFILSYTDFEVLTSQSISLTNNNIIFPYFSFSVGDSDLLNKTNLGIVQKGYIRNWTALYSPGFYSVLGSRPFYCSYYENGSYHSCLYNSDYYSDNSFPGLSSINYYNLSPMIYFNDNNTHSINAIHMKIGYSGDGFILPSNQFYSFYTTIPVINGSNPTNYPLAYFDSTTTTEIKLPISRSSDMCSIYWYQDDSTKIYSLPQSEYIPVYPGMDSSELTPEQQEIVDAVNGIFDQFTPDFWNSITSGNSVLNAVTGLGINDSTAPLGSFLGNSYSTGFTGLFEAIFQTPLELLEEQMDYDLWNGSVGYTNYNYCLGSHLDGSSLTNPKVVLWEYKTGNNTYNRYSVDIPCMTDLYSKINSPSGSYGFTAFYPIYRTIIDGILIYYLLVQLLAFYKYVLEPKNSKVEVLEL